MSTGTIHPLLSGGVLVDVGEAFPVWRPDTGAMRRLLLELDLRDTTDHPDRDPGPLTIPPSGEPAAGSAPTGPAATNLPGHASARAGGAFTSG